MRCPVRRPPVHYFGGAAYPPPPLATDAPAGAHASVGRASASGFGKRNRVRDGPDMFRRPTRCPPMTIKVPCLAVPNPARPYRATPRLDQPCLATPCLTQPPIAPEVPGDADRSLARIKTFQTPLWTMPHCIFLSRQRLQSVCKIPLERRNPIACVVLSVKSSYRPFGKTSNSSITICDQSLTGA